MPKETKSEDKRKGWYIYPVIVIALALVVLALQNYKPSVATAYGTTITNAQGRADGLYPPYNFSNIPNIEKSWVLDYGSNNSTIPNYIPAHVIINTSIYCESLASC